MPQEVAMIDRRQLFTVSGLLGALGPSVGAGGDDVAFAAGQQLSPQAAQDLINAVKDIRTAIAAGGGDA